MSTHDRIATGVYPMTLSNPNMRPYWIMAILCTVLFPFTVRN